MRAGAGVDKRPVGHFEVGAPPRFWRPPSYSVIIAWLGEVMVASICVFTAVPLARADDGPRGGARVAGRCVQRHSPCGQALA